MAVSDYMFDLASQVSGVSGTVPKHTTNKKAGASLDMDGFLQLMVATLQNQTMDNTADMSEMMNQMVQMSVIQAITDISTLVSDSTSLTYAASLVGKTVTLGQYDAHGKLSEFERAVTGTGVLNGQQVIFCGDECYNLTDIMAIGRLPAGEALAENGDQAGEEIAGAAEETAQQENAGLSGEEKLLTEIRDLLKGETGSDVVIEHTVEDIPEEWGAAEDAAESVDETSEEERQVILQQTVEDIPAEWTGVEETSVEESAAEEAVENSGEAG